jgi:protein phosphatase
MKCRFTGKTDTGILRSVNQDAYYMDPDGRFFILADGMGGHAGGQEASRLATKEISAYLEEHWNSDSDSEKMLEEALMQANQAILDDQESHPERRDMGTTVVALLFRDEQPWCAHVGDSRLYLLRESQLKQVTGDHTWIAQALKDGDLTSEQARVHPWRHVLSQCLGRKDQETAEVQSLDLKTGDILLLCSDGLTEEVSDELISEHLQSEADFEELPEHLVEAAKKAGGSDNITVLLISVEE